MGFLDGEGKGNFVAMNRREGSQLLRQEVKLPHYSATSTLQCDDDGDFDDVDQLLQQEGDMIDELSKRESEQQHQDEVMAAMESGGEKGAANSQGASSEMITGCESCGDPRLDNELLKYFSVRVCFNCKKKSREISKRRGDGVLVSEAYDFELVTKTVAKEQYLVTDSELKTLNSCEKENPRKSSWNNMVLFLRRDLRKASETRWGSLELVEEEKQRRKAARVSKLSKSARSSSASSILSSRSKKKQKSSNQQRAEGPLKRLKLAAEAAHAHQYPSETETYNEKEDEWTKTCSICGFQVRFQRF